MSTSAGLTRSGTCPASPSVDELRVLGVVHDDLAAEAPRELRACTSDSSSRRPGAAREAAGDEDRLVPARDARALELADAAATAALARIGRRAGDRQARRLDDDRRARRAATRAPRAAGPRAGSAARRGRPLRRRRRSGRGGGGRSTTASSGAFTTASRTRRGAGHAPRRGDVDSGRAIGGAANRLDGDAPKTLTGAELQLDDGPARDVGALPRRRQQPRLPRLLRAARGARDDARASRRTRCSASRTCSSSCSRTTGRRASPSPGTRGPSHRGCETLDDVQVEGRKPMPDLLREQFPYFRPIVEAFGYRNLEFEGWEADDVIATLATRADEAGIEDLRRLDRPRRVPARHRERHADDDAARRRRRERLHAGARRGALRHHARPDSGLHRAQGRHVRQHPRRSGNRRQDRRAADRAVRLARGGDRARRRALARARGRTSASTRTRRACRRSSRRCAATSTLDCDPAELVLAAARPLAAEGDVPALRVPRPARAASTRSTRPFPAADDARGRAQASRGARASCRSSRGARRLAVGRRPLRARP